MPTAAPSERAAATRWPVVIAVFLASVAGTLQIGKAPPALPILRAELGLDLVEGGWIASIVFLAGALTGAAGGMVADRIGYRRTVLGGFFCLLIGTVLGGAAPGFAVLLLGRFVEGIGYLAILVGGTPIVAAAATERDRRAALGLLSSYFPCGMTAAMLIAPLGLGLLGWRGLWAANIAVILALLALFLIWVPRRDFGFARASADRLTLADVGATLARPGPWLLAAMFVIMSICNFSIMAWMPTFFAEELGFSTTVAALLTAVFVASLIPFMAASGWFIQRGLPRWAMLSAAAVAIGTLPLGVFAPDVAPVTRLACAVPLALLSSFIAGAAYAGVPLHAPDRRRFGVVTGVIVQGNTLGQFIGPPIIAALVVATGGWDGMRWLYPFVGVAGLAITLALHRVEQRLTAVSLPSREREGEGQQPR
ncbi:MAG: MFS transporter [Alphaproteobacteria bacterium]|nr:MFS transporter [Alphaproteobacteria bacterium]